MYPAGSGETITELALIVAGGKSKVLHTPGLERAAANEALNVVIAAATIRPSLTVRGMVLITL